MSDAITIALIILSELAILQSIGIAVYFLRRKKHGPVDIEKAKAAFQRITQNSKRADELVPLLRETYEINDDTKIQQAVSLIFNDENALYKSVIKAIATTDYEAVTNIGVLCNTVLHHYHTLAKTLKEKHGNLEQTLNQTNSELHNDVEKLRGELKATLATMESTLSEYANMYSVKAAGRENDPGFKDLKTTVDNAKQHAQHTMKKIDDAMSGMENNPVSTPTHAPQKPQKSGTPKTTPPPAVAHTTANEGFDLETDLAGLEDLEIEEPELLVEQIKKSANR